MIRTTPPTPRAEGQGKERPPAAGRRASGGGRPAAYRTQVPWVLGPLVLEADDQAVTRVYLPGTAPADPAADWSATPDHLRAAAGQVREYLGGTRRSFELPLSATGTPFQRGVWNALAGIPFGETISYAELARRVGRPGAFRAVGQANGANPLPIVVPCHRVVASGGGIGGYGGGLPMKRWLLALEGARATAGPGG